MNMAAIPKSKYAPAQVTDSKNSAWVAKSPQSPQEFVGKQVAGLVNEHKFFKPIHNFSGSGGTDILLCSPWMSQPI